MRHAHIVSSIALAAVVLLAGCRSDQQVAENSSSNTSSSSSTPRADELTLPSGTSIDITLATTINSKTASVGDAWTGSTRNASVVDGRNVIPAGSSVSGTVTGVQPAHKGDRAMLDLGLTSVTVGDRTYRVRGSTESIVAGSTRARNLGAIGAATAVGAVVGNKAGGSTKGTIVGGLIGGGAATGVVSQTKGYRVELDPGTPLTFTTNESVAVRL